MGKIKNTSLDNIHGSGKQQIYTDNSGKQYRIKNSSLDNVHGDGKQKIVEEVGSGDSFLADLIFNLLPEKVQTLLGIAVFGVIIWIMVKMAIMLFTLCF